MKPERGLISMGSLLIVFLLVTAAHSATVKGKTTLFTANSPDWSVSAGWGDGDHYYYYYFNAGAPPSPPETATCQLSISQPGLYDVYIGSYVRNDYSPDVRYIVNFKPGGAYYQVENDLRRINSIDNTNASAGQVKISATLYDAGNTLLRDCIFLGRYEFDVGAYNLVVTTQGMTASGFVATPWVGVTGLQSPKASPTYQDIDGTIAFWWMNFDEPNQYYWGGHAPDLAYKLYDSQFFCFASSDRSVSGSSNVEFTEVYGSSATPPDQPVDLPITVYFEPGTSYVPPAVGGMITSVDESQASNGIIVIDVNTQSLGTVSLGNYYFDANKTYGAKIDDWPITYAGLSAVFLRKYAFSFSPWPPLTPTPTQTPTPTPTPTATPTTSTLELLATADRVEMSNAVQKIVFDKTWDPTVPGKFSNAAGFQGVASRKLTIPSLTEFNSAERSVEFWAKLSPSSTYQVIVERGPKTTGHWEVYTRPATGYVAFYIPDLTPADVASNVSITDDQWHFISFRIHSGQVTLAVDGSVAVDQSVSGTIASTSEPILVGALPEVEAPSEFPITGAVDDLRLSNVYRSSVAVPSASLPVDGNTIGMYRFDSTVGNTFPDESSSNNSATIPFSTTFKLTTYVKNGASWEPLFDGQHPLVEGSSFNLEPTSYVIIEDSVARKAVQFSGTHSSPSYNWDVLVEANWYTPLIKFMVTCHLTSSLTISSPQPNVAFWIKEPSPAVIIEQGPMNIYGGYGAGFPAAYLWNDGKQAVVFFNMTPMTWMGPANVWRFLNCRIKSITQGGQTGLGLQTFALSGATIPSGDMDIEYYLYGSARGTQPGGMEALDTMVNVCAPLHPANSSFPVTRESPYQTSWTVYAEKAIDELMWLNITYYDVASSWDDDPLNLVNPVPTLRVHACHPYGGRGDFSCCNNHLSPWILFTRLNTADPGKRDFAVLKKDGLPLYYDPLANLIRWGTREPLWIGDMSMSWQNFFFHLETMRTYETLAAQDFNPAIAGRFLMATSGLIEYAHNVNYIFSQWFDPYLKQPITQQDVPELGDVREPWQVGTYAYLMLLAYETTGNNVYLQEAEDSIEILLTSMTYTMSNAVYTVTYTDPVQFPITELFGNAYGIVAAYKIYELTGDTNNVKYSRYFMDSLLRLTFWYEDETDAVSRDLKNLGLFYPHGGAYCATPWETTDAYIAIAWALKHDTDLPIKELLLKLANLYRINAFYFYPPTWSDTVRAHHGDYAGIVNKYHPIEPFYTLEGGGHVGTPASYMANTGMWNYWMYEALAEADDREVMVLNLNVLENYEEALSSAERNFIVYNPTIGTKSFSLLCKSLATGNYTMTIKDSAGNVTQITRTDSQLSAGIPLTLGSLDYIRVTLEHENASSMKTAINLWKTAQDKLSYAYQLLQEYTRDHGITSDILNLKSQFLSAMSDYNSQQYESAKQKAQAIIDWFFGSTRVDNWFLY